MANSSNESYVWNANDYSNIITIGASALASVLLVIFKSRCRTINLCCGLIGCNRDVMTESEEEDNNNNNDDNNNNNNNLPIIPPQPNIIPPNNDDQNNP
tara:strand:- start:1551 stop:1847 length:297 start_codon:yes stop_codon:yes gene_type:complete